MRRSQAEFPLLYGPSQRSDGGSESSSRLQAEVQSQLEEYKAKQQSELDSWKWCACEKRGTKRGRCDMRRQGGFFRANMYQKGAELICICAMSYLRVKLYQKAINIHYHYLNQGICAGVLTYLRVSLHQKGIMVHYLKMRTYPRALHYLRDVPERNHGPQSTHPLPVQSHLQGYVVSDQGARQLPARLSKGLGVSAVMYPGILPEGHSIPKHLAVQPGGTQVMFSFNFRWLELQMY